MNKRKRSVFSSIASIVHQCVPSFSELSVLAVKKGYLPFSQISNIYSLWSTHMVCRKNANKVFIYLAVVEIFNCRFYLNIWYSFKHFVSCRTTPALFYSVICQVRFQYTFYFVVFYSFYTSVIYCRCLFNSLFDDILSEGRQNSPLSNQFQILFWSSSI